MLWRLGYREPFLVPWLCASSSMADCVRRRWWWWCLVVCSIPHGDFGTYLQDKGALQEEDAARLIVQLASGVDYLHHIGIVHRYGYCPERGGDSILEMGIRACETKMGCVVVWWKTHDCCVTTGSSPVLDSHVGNVV